MFRALLAGCCLVGVAVGAAFVPGIGVGTPIPDLGDETGGGPQLGGDVAGFDGAPPVDSGVGNVGGVSAGGYPETATIGGELELSDRRELVVESPRRSRWRLGAYATYTGKGFERAGEPEPLREPLSPAAAGSTDTYEIQATVERPFRALVSVWRPAFADAGGGGVSVTQEGGLLADGGVETGETYTTVTYGPPPPAAAVESTDREYPAAIESRYTQLPDDTPDRLAERTGEITTDAETPYEQAAAVERWLESNKEYSLNASHDRSGDVADEFVFEMETGYCQYFATAMVAMLRTQDIPARYVTGYGRGEAVGENSYLLRGKNAHAWVEVYAADVGWVTFDPTPAGGRAEAGRDESRQETPTPTPTRTPTETPTPSPTRTPTNASEAFDVAFTPDPVPGEAVTVTVTRDEQPVAGATVLFNGEAIGETDAAGNVTGEVPYRSQLEIVVETDDPALRVGGGVLGGYGAAPRPVLAGENTTVTVDVPTDVAIAVSGPAVAGEPLDLVATVADRPVGRAEVRLDGESVARTDEAGTATVSVPDAATIELAVQRGDVSGNRTLEVRREPPDEEEDPVTEATLNLSVSPSLGVALPYTSADVVVENGGRPVPNATVTLDGRSVGATGPNGSVTAELPLSASATVTAVGTVGQGRPASGETSVERLLRNLAAVAGAGLAFILALAAIGYRRGLTPRLLAGGLARIVSRAVGGVLAAVVGVAGAVDSGLSALLGALERTARRLTRGLDGVVALLAAARSGLGRAARLVGAAIGRLHPSVVRSYLQGLWRSTAPAALRPGAATDDAGASGDGPLTAREAWAELRGYVSIRSWRTSTPGEIARWAVDRDDLPESPVATLRDGFRAAEYGSRQADDDELRRALERIRQRRCDEEAEEEP